MLSYSKINELLEALELELRALDVWQSLPPSAQALASTQPFAIDTMDLHQWLQWIFIPRMYALIDADAALPKACGIQPMLETWGDLKGKSVLRLNEILLALDEVLSQ